MTQLEKDLRAARAIIDKGGLCKRSLALTDGRHCALGAILAGAFKKNVLYWSPAQDPLGPRQTLREKKMKAVLVKAIRERTGTSMSIAYFNDRPETTKTGVLAVFDRAIRKVAV
jgi:hypothetical protein